MGNGNPGKGDLIPGSYEADIVYAVIFVWCQQHFVLVPSVVQHVFLPQLWRVQGASWLPYAVVPS
jgi:hypothetical protein